MKQVRRLSLYTVFAAAVLALTGCGQKTAEVKEPAFHRVVIQVSTNDPRTQTIALNNAANVRKSYGRDNVDVQVVAYGPGLSLLTRKSKNAQRVASMAMEGVHFNACGNTMKKIARKTGHKPALTNGVVVVPAGVGRIMELQEQGYAYVRP